MYFLSTLLASLVFVSVFFITPVSAQTTSFPQTPQEIINSVENDIRVQTTPQYPKEGENVNIDLISYSTDLDRATITWMVNGKVVLRGIGQKSFSIQNGPIGSKTVVAITIKTSNGVVVERSVTLRPSHIDIIWQATSYTPPLYDGKALYAHQGLITFVAIPNFGKATTFDQTKNYIFKWDKDGDVLGDFSGYGQNTFSLRGTIISKPFNIGVSVTAQDGSVVGYGSVAVTPQSPSLSFYEDSSLYGLLYNRVLSTVNLVNREFNIFAARYNFNVDPEPNTLQYNWTMNDRSIPQQQVPYELTLRAQGDINGTANINLQLQNTDKILQFANQTVTINFKAPVNQNGL